VSCIAVIYDSIGAGTSAHVDVRVTPLVAATAAARTAALDSLVDAQVASDDDGRR